MIRRVAHKYKARPCEADGIKFSSQREGRYYRNLTLRQKGGDVLFFLRQVPLHLPGGVRYVCDFVEFLRSGEVRFVDVKGMETETFKVKKRIVEATYPITIEIE